MVAQSLDRIRARDLSVHLLNAHALKKRVADAEWQRGGRSRSAKRRKGKERAIPAEDPDVVLGAAAENGDSSIRLSKDWTAWPMPPDLVPSEEFLPRLGDGRSGLRAPVDPRPSAVLEECLIATITRIARQTWERREWESEGEKEVENAGEESMTDLKDERATDPESRDTDMQEEDAAGDEHVLETWPEDTSEGGSDPPMFTSQAFGASDEDDDGNYGPSSVAAMENESDQEEEIGKRPVPLVDDDRARQILLPSTRHILTQLDDLLLGLHTARTAYAVKKPRKTSSSRTGDDTTTTDASRDRGRSSHRPSQTEREASTQRARAGASASSSQSTTSLRDSNRTQRLGLRDWSDVMGMASLAGWDKAVVARASARCARLFGENMMFRTFYEGEAQTGARSYFTEHCALGQNTSPEPEAHSTRAEMVRTSEACSACRQSKTKCEPADSQPGTGTCKHCLDNGQQCSGITTKSGRVDSRTCPYTSCERHAVPFRRQHLLQRHIDRVHAGDGPPSSPSRWASSDADVFRDDQIVCPVGDCPRHGRPFARGAKLYQHIRRMHPELDVEEIKRLETSRRGERRGKWRDERRHRSRSERRSSESMRSGPRSRSPTT